MRQGIYKVEKIMSHLRAKSALGNLIHVVLEWYQLTAGIKRPILEETAPIEYFYCPWVHDLRKSLATLRATVKYPEAWVPKPQRESDACVMDLFKEEPSIEMEGVNLVRIYKTYCMSQTS